MKSAAPTVVHGVVAHTSLLSPQRTLGDAASTMTADYPVTPAVRALRDLRISFVPHVFEYVAHGGALHSAEALGVPAHQVIKTLVMVADTKTVLLVLMHGDCEVSTKQLARTIGVKRVDPADAALATRATGYQFGGTSPFGTRKPLPVYVERTVFDLDKIYINGGKRGFLVEIPPGILRTAFALTEVDVAISE